MLFQMPGVFLFFPQHNVFMRWCTCQNNSYSKNGNLFYLIYASQMWLMEALMTGNISYDVVHLL